MRKVYKHHYLYRIERKDTGEYYIGIRSTDEDPESDPYWGSGIRISASVTKHGTGKFTKTILGVFATRKDVALAEARTVTEEMLLDPLCLNLKTGGEYLTGVTYSDEVCRKISQAITKHYADPENRERLSQKLKEKFAADPEYRLAIKEARHRALRDPAHRRRALAAVRKSFLETDRIKKVTAALRTPEVRAKRSASMKAYASSNDGRKKISCATKGTVYITKDGVDRRVKASEVEQFLIAGWSLGSGRLIKSITKEKCGNSTRGKKWMYNLATAQRRRIHLDETQAMLDAGWKYGQGTKQLTCDYFSGQRFVPNQLKSDT